MTVNKGHPFGQYQDILEYDFNYYLRIVVAKRQLSTALSLDVVLFLVAGNIA